MKKMFTRFFFLLLSTALVSPAAFSQTAFRSIAGGLWSDFATTWERTANVYNPTPTWAVPASAPTSNHIVIVRATHTVTTNATHSCLNLIIENGGILNPGATLRVGVPTSNTGGSIDTLTVDGTLGAIGQQTALELGSGAASLWIRGAGTMNIGRFRPNNANVNYPGSAVASAVSGARVLIDRDVNLHMAGNYALSLLNSTPSINDSLSLTIFPGRTVTVVDPTGYFHNSFGNGLTGFTTAGKYVYNINGTLDLSANTDPTGGTRFIAFGPAASSLTLNVGGILKLGGYFKADTISTSLGALYLNINNGGLVDASLTSTFNVGTVGASAATPNIYFVTTGTGALRRTAVSGGAGVKFPLGINTTSYNPLTITNATGPDETFTVGLTSTPIVPPPPATLPRAWGIAEGTPGGNAVTLAFSWTTADEGASGFVSTDVVYVAGWDPVNSKWVTVPATKSVSAGTLADPYVATVTGPFVSTAYVLTNTFIPTPVALVNVKASKKATGIQVEFGNATELDVKNYVIEKSANGRNFVEATTLLAKTNNGLLNNYTYLDAAPYRGNNSYRIKATEKNGTVKYSPVVSINTERTGTNVNVYPNPVKGNNVSIQLENLDKAVYSIAIYNSMGQKVYSKQLKHDGNSSTVVADLPSSVKTGVYRVQVSSAATMYVKNIVVE